MQRKPSAKPKPKRKAPPPKAGAGREGGIRSISSIRRQNLSTVRHRYGPVEQQQDRFMKRTAGARKAASTSMRRWDELIRSGQAVKHGNSVTIGMRKEGGASSSFFINRPTKKPTR